MTTFASGRYSIGICGRCGFKTAYKDLREDGNIPGFYVCQDSGCYDKLDPYKKPARTADPVALHHPRPDVPLVPIQPLILGSPDQQSPLIDQNGNYIIPA